MTADTREMYEITPDEVTVGGIVYRKRPSMAGHPCWDGGAVGGIVFINWLNSVTKVIDPRNPWQGGGRSCRTFEAAADVARKDARREYEQAKKIVEAYEKGGS